MNARRQLELRGYKLERVLMTGKAGKAAQAVRITVYGEVFPERALAPEILVGETRADMVRIAADQRSISGFLKADPEPGAVVRVRYGDSQEGRAEEPVDPERIRPLPEDCRTL
jgi:hypothetical protein